MSNPAIELEHVCFKIGVFEMSDFSLSISQGEYFVLTGPNGSGKTLLIKLIAGLYRPLAGRVRLSGRDVTPTPPWNRNIGYVPQDGLLFRNRTVRGNIRFAMEVRRITSKRIEQSVDRVAHLLKIAHLLDRSVNGLSGGECQKTALARALVFEPRVLLLDEPVSAIDEDSRDGLCHDLRRIQRALGIAVLHVSHNRREIDLVADRIGILECGRIARVDARESPGANPPSEAAGESRE